MKQGRAPAAKALVAALSVCPPRFCSGWKLNSAFDASSVEILCYTMLAMRPEKSLSSSLSLLWFGRLLQSLSVLTRIWRFPDPQKKKFPPQQQQHRKLCSGGKPRVRIACRCQIAKPAKFRAPWPRGPGRDPCPPDSPASAPKSARSFGDRRAGFEARSSLLLFSIGAERSTCGPPAGDDAGRWS